MLTFIVLPHCGIRSETLLPDTNVIQSHYTDTGATSPSPTPKIRMPSGKQLVPLLTTLECRGPGSNPEPPDLGADTLLTELPRLVSYICDKCDYFDFDIINFPTQLKGS